MWGNEFIARFKSNCFFLPIQNQRINDALSSSTGVSRLFFSFSVPNPPAPYINRLAFNSKYLFRVLMVRFSGVVTTV